MNNLPAVGDQTSTQLFLQSAEHWANKTRWQVPDKQGWKAVSWDSYRNNVCNISAYLHGQGIGYPEKIGILASNSLEWIYCAMGVMTSTAILVPIYAGNTIEQSLFMIKHSDMKVLITESPALIRNLLAAGLESSDVNLIILLTGNPEDCSTNIPVYRYEDVSLAGANIISSNPELIDELANIPQQDDTAYMIYTSGTTGKPKGVPLSHRNLSASTRDWVTVNGHLIPEQVIDIHWLPNAHIYGWGAVGLGNLFGFESYLGSPLNLLDLLPIVKPNIFLSVPAYYEKLYLDALNSCPDKPGQFQKLSELTGGKFNFMLSGGAGLKIEIKEFFMESGLWITEGYGLSECSPTLTMNHVDDFRFDSVGKPFPSVQIQLAPDGEILAKGENIFSGYYKDPESTKASFTDDGWFRTGDLGSWMEGGFLKIVDRKKDIIVTTGGKNIAPQRIERMFVDHPHIEHLLVYGNSRKYIVALVTLNESSIRQWLQANDVAGFEWEEIIRRSDVMDLVQQSVDSVNAELASYESIKYFHISEIHFTPQNNLLTAAMKPRRKAATEQFIEQLDELYQVQRNTSL